MRWLIRVVMMIAVGFGVLPGRAWAEGAKPRRPSAHDQVAFAREMIDRGHPDAAVSFLEDAIAMEPANADAYELLGDAYVMLGLQDKATIAYEKLLTLAPHSRGAVEASKWLAQRKARIQS